MLLMIQYELSCFADNAELVGSALDKSFTLYLNDAGTLDPACISSKTKPADAKLLFLHNSKQVYISAAFDYSNATGPYLVLFEDIDAAEVCLEDGSIACTPYTPITSLFDYMEAQSLMSYSVLLLGSVPNSGGLNSIRTVKMNTTNCWGDMMLRYDLSAGHETVAVVGEPLDCKINDPVVKFEFKYGDVWEEFVIEGDSSYNSSCYYKGRGSFDFETVNCYMQELSKMTDPTQIEQFNLFVEAFEYDLTLKTRILMLTPVEGSATMFETVIKEMEQLNTLNDKCYSQMNPEVFITEAAVYIRTAPDAYSSTECEQNPVSLHILLELYNETSQVVFAELVYTKEEYLSQVVHEFYDTRIAEYFAGRYFTHFFSVLEAYDANGEVLLGSSVRSTVYYSCLVFSQFHFIKGKVCLDVVLLDTPQCRFEGIIDTTTYLGVEANGYTSLTTYLVYSMKIQYFSERTMYCSSELLPQFINKQAPGTAAERKKQFLKIAEKSPQNVVVQYLGKRECIYTNLVLLDDKQVLFISMVLVAAVVGLCAVGISVYLIVKEVQK